MIFAHRLEPAHRIVAVGGGKGGVGKTTVTTLVALSAAASGARVGLLDLDIHGGAAHLFLGMNPTFPEEEGGIIPFPGPHGVCFMSAIAFSGERPLVLRGAEVSDAIAELLAVTIWPELDLLLVDLPPGLGESLLEVFRFMPRAEIVAVTTASKPSVQVAARFIAAARAVAPVLGVVENMADGAGPDGGPGGASVIHDLGVRFSAPVLGSVPADPGLEAAIGDAGALLATRAGVASGRIADSITAH